MKRSLHQSRHALEEDLRKKLPATVAELHARVVGPDDPSWTRDILSIDRVWMGGCLLVLDIEIRFRGVLPPVMRALERPVKIPRMVMEGIGHPAVAAEACGAAGAGIAPGAAGGVGGSGAKGWGRMAGPRLQDGWALPLLQRRLEIALIAEATRSNILGAMMRLLLTPLNLYDSLPSFFGSYSAFRLYSPLPLTFHPPYIPSYVPPSLHLSLLLQAPWTRCWC